MSQKELVFRIGGAAGDGSASTAESLAKICTRSGLFVFTYTSYQSVIRGGHSWVQVRAGEEPVLSQGERPQVLICLNQPTADIHAPQVRENGAIIYDSDTIKLDGLRIAEGVRKIGFPLARTAREYSNNALMKNTVALGAAVRLFDLDLGVVVKQVEDELAAMNMAIGAGFAGVRSMTATSGGGFCLMVEAIGQGGMVEAPVVAVLAQRAGPSTGLPTKTEQGDLNLALGAGQGDWPRAILAPRNTDECFRLTAEAFNLAEVYQTPVIVMSDLYLSEGYRTVEGFDFNVPIIRGLLAADGGERRERYLRYKLTDSGVSPRALPGQEGFQHDAGTDEHDEKGELISDVLAGIPEWIEIRRQMMDKRMKKLDGLLRDTKGPELWGPKNADLTLISWGSTHGPLREAILDLQESDGLAVNSLEYSHLFPFHAQETAEILGKAKKTLAVEGNFSGQFSRLLTAETGIKPNHFLGKYDGEPFYPSEIAAKVREVLG